MKPLERRHDTPEMRRALKAVAEAFGITVEKMLKVDEIMMNARLDLESAKQARKYLVHLLRHDYGLLQKDIAGVIGRGRTAVYEALHFKAHEKHLREIREIVEALKQEEQHEARKQADPGNVRPFRRAAF